MKVVLVGPPHSGKSCLRVALKSAIRDLPGAPYPYWITANPDGEGAWFQETASLNPDLAATLRADYKTLFTPEFVARVADEVRGCDQPLTLVDVGGRVSPENALICASCSHAIILSRGEEDLLEWRNFTELVGLEVVAEITSDYFGDRDRVHGVTQGVLRGSVHRLERGEPANDRPLVRALARYLVELHNHRVVEGEGLRQ